MGTSIHVAVIVVAVFTIYFVLFFYTFRLCCFPHIQVATASDGRPLNLMLRQRFLSTVSEKYTSHGGSDDANLSKRYFKPPVGRRDYSD